MYIFKRNNEWPLIPMFYKKRSIKKQQKKKKRKLCLVILLYTINTPLLYLNTCKNKICNYNRDKFVWKYMLRRTNRYPCNHNRPWTTWYTTFIPLNIANLCSDNDRKDRNYESLMKHKVKQIWRIASTIRALKCYIILLLWYPPFVTVRSIAQRNKTD